MMMFDLRDFQKAVQAARRAATKSERVVVKEFQRSATVRGAYSLTYGGAGKRPLSSRTAARLEDGEAVQKDADGNVVFRGTIVEIKAESCEITVLGDGDMEPRPRVDIDLKPVDYYKALEDFSRGLKDEDDAKFFERMAREIRDEEEMPAPAVPAEGLREAQRVALEKALSRKLSFVWGPPGTGKSYTVGHIVARLREQEKSVLLLSTTNVAVDVATWAVDDACSGMGAPLCPQECVRLSGRLTSIPEYQKRPALCSYTDTLRKFNARQLDLEKKYADLCAAHRDNPDGSDFEFGAQRSKLEQEMADLGEARKKALEDLVFSAKILAVTFTSAIFRHLLEKRRFDVIVVDEASQIPLAAWIYLVSLREGRNAPPQIVVAGDPLQLQPICPDLLGRDDSCVKDWFGKNVYSHVGIRSMGDATLPGVTFLSEQTRMRKEICEAVSRTFYGNRLHGSAKELFDENLAAIAVLACRRGNSDAQSSFSPRRRRGNRSPKSHVSGWAVLAVAEYVDSLVKRYGNGGRELTVRVLSAFKNQRRNLEEELLAKTYPKNIRVEISTVHAAQGAEADIVIYDVSDELEDWFVNAENPDAKNLWCVAVSRARCQCVLVLALPETRLRNNPYAEELFRNSEIIRLGS